MSIAPHNVAGPFALTASLLLAAAVAVMAPACSSNTPSDGSALRADGPGGGETGPVLASSDDGGTGDGLAIQPNDPTVDVTVTDGAVTATPITFTASAKGAAVAATFTLDRGDLGELRGAQFAPSGSVAGVGTITASFGALRGTTKVTVRVNSTSNGPTQGDTGGKGVGGDGPATKVEDAVRMKLLGASVAPSGPGELEWLYPYDKTVWPRGVLAPLLQWRTTHVAQAVYVHLTESGYDFRGFYGGAQPRQALSSVAWAQATRSNQGDPLVIELKILAGDTVYGPIRESWTIAPAPLKGTVYYNSYNTKLAAPVVGEQVGAAVLSITSGATEPTLAIPGSGQACNVCHQVSADGSTLYAQSNAQSWRQGADNYNEGSSFDLKQSASLVRRYGPPDGKKFLWSAPFPDGSFAMASAGSHTQESYTGGPSRLFRRADAQEIPTSGFTDVVTNAVTPSFAPDGRSIAFNFWDGAGTATVRAGSGHSLAVMDFDCGPTGGSCGAPPYRFSGLREVYANSATFPGWPSFVPDGNALVFHNTVRAPTSDSPLATWQGAQAELWWASAAPGATQAIRLDALNGTGYLPTGPNHPNDATLNYQPTVNPIPSGGYYWVVFTSRRMYGNVADGDPFEQESAQASHVITKKLWVAAVDIHPTPGADPSHPAFYLPGQELGAGNMRGFWVVDPCRAEGSGCESGDECCTGFCRGPSGRALCTQPPTGCAQTYEKCISAADCCGTGRSTECINGRCATVTVK